MRLPAPREWDSRGNLMIEVDETNPPPDAVKGGRAVGSSPERDLRERLSFHPPKPEGVHQVEGGCVVFVHVTCGNFSPPEDLLREGAGQGPRVPASAIGVEHV